MPKPNVLFLHSHNTGRFIQLYGHAVPAPNLQRLAEEGVLFRRAFAAAPTCSPSRASFLTGQYPHVSGMLGLAHRGWGLTVTKQHIAHTLRNSGYTTVLCGVEHTAPHGDNRADPVGYDRVLPVESAHADQVGPTVVDFLASKPEPPFFMSVGLHETHIPFPEPDPQSQPAEDPRYCQPPPPLPDTPKIFDPDETNNLIGEPFRSPLLDEMGSRLSRWMEETDVPLLLGPVPAPSGVRVNDPDGLSWGEPTLLSGLIRKPFRFHTPSIFINAVSGEVCQASRF